MRCKGENLSYCEPRVGSEIEQVLNEQNKNGHNADHNQRIEQVEIKLMEMENTVQQLNEVILRQYRDIERLQLQCEELMRRSESSVGTDATPSALDEKPPHY